MGHLYKTLGTIGFAAGSVLLLTPEQIAAREGAVTVTGPAKSGRSACLVNTRVEFKGGEIVGTEDEQPRSLEILLEPVAKVKAAAKKSADGGGPDTGGGAGGGGGGPDTGGGAPAGGDAGGGAGDGAGAPGGA